MHLARMLRDTGIPAVVTGRPKHLYSIHRKMQQKGKSLEGILDLRGLRVIVLSVAQCYAALDIVHQLWPVIESEFDDYIARPKPNGYRSLHTVVTAWDGLPLEVQNRTQAMHEAAEYGLASHWRYKEGAGGASGAGRHDDDDAARTVEWVRALLAWQKEVGQALGSGDARLHAGGQAPVHALTPLGRVIELPAGATPVDFAYHVHSSLGHRCRGARVNGQLVPLNRPLESGQTVEIITVKEGAAEGPSRDWLNPALGYVASPRARTKVRQWFNALEIQRDQASGRERVERILQREGRTALAFEDLARRLGQPDVASMFVAVAREEIGPRQIEDAARAEPAAGGGLASPQVAATSLAERPFSADAMLKVRSTTGKARSDVLIVGVDSLLSQLARCCRPVPPDPIAGFVTRGRGVSVHRADCETLARLSAGAPERIIETQWDLQTRAPSVAGSHTARFAADIEVIARDRQGLLRDISEVFARDRINVTGAQTQSRLDEARMRFTIEVADSAQLAGVLAALRQVQGVSAARRRSPA
jgi:GTP pyrophosphokinase